MDKNSIYKKLDQIFEDTFGIGDKPADVMGMFGGQKGAFQEVAPEMHQSQLTGDIKSTFNAALRNRDVRNAWAGKSNKEIGKSYNGGGKEKAIRKAERVKQDIIRTKENPTAMNSESLSCYAHLIKLNKDNPTLVIDNIVKSIQKGIGNFAALKQPLSASQERNDEIMFEEIFKVAKTYYPDNDLEVRTILAMFADDNMIEFEKSALQYKNILGAAIKK